MTQEAYQHKARAIQNCTNGKCPHLVTSYFLPPLKKSNNTSFRGATCKERSDNVTALKIRPHGGTPAVTGTQDFTWKRTQTRPSEDGSQGRGFQRSARGGSRLRIRNALRFPRAGGVVPHSHRALLLSECPGVNQCP